MSTFFSKSLRKQVAKRANYRCEYCLVSEQDTYFGFEIDHVISKKHGGTDSADNLAYTCFLCNRHKGSDIGSLNNETGELVRFYNPRTDRWTEHFALQNAQIVPLTDIGLVTLRVLQLNTGARIKEREDLLQAGRYPIPE